MLYFIFLGSCINSEQKVEIRSTSQYQYGPRSNEAKVDTRSKSSGIEMEEKRPVQISTISEIDNVNTFFRRKIINEDILKLFF